MNVIAAGLVYLLCVGNGRRVRTTEGLDDKAEQNVVVSNDQTFVATRLKANTRLEHAVANGNDAKLQPQSFAAFVRASSRPVSAFAPAVSSPWRRHPQHLCTSRQQIAERHERSVLQGSVIDDSSTQTDLLRSFMFPMVRYTSPTQIVGWRGRPEFGENASEWYDIQGVRNGSVLNAWRQRNDERAYTDVVEAVSDLLSETSDESRLRDLERKMGIRSPLRTWKYLGDWIPLVANGCNIARIVGDLRILTAPAAITISRVGQRKTVDHTYGTFDVNMDEGEALKIVVSSKARTNVGYLNAVEGREPYTVRFAEEGDDRFYWAAGSPFAMEMGNVTLISEYLLVRRAPSGELLDVYLRRDDRAGDELSGDASAYVDVKRCREGVDGALDRSRDQRGEFRNNFLRMVFGLKAGVPNITTQDPNWGMFAADFSIIDPSGAEVKGLSTAKFLHGMLRQFQDSHIDSFKVLSMVAIPKPPIVYQWSMSLDFGAYSFVKILGNCTFRFDPDGKIGAMKIDDLSVDGERFPKLAFPELSPSPVTPQDEALLKKWTTELFERLRPSA